VAIKLYRIDTGKWRECRSSNILRWHGCWWHLESQLEWEDNADKECIQGTWERRPVYEMLGSYLESFRGCWGRKCLFWKTISICLKILPCCWIVRINLP